MFSSCCGRGKNAQDGEDAASDGESEVADDGWVDSSSGRPDPAASSGDASDGGRLSR